MTYAKPPAQTALSVLCEANNNNSCLEYCTSSCPLSLLHDIPLLYAVRTQKRSCPASPAIAEENMIIKTHATDGFRRLFIAIAVVVFL